MVRKGAWEEETAVASAGPPPPQVVRVKRSLLAARMTCPLCHRLFRDATTISECLHTFCRKCIYEKLTDEEFDCCPICNIDLGCSPVEKLRPDHNVQDVRTKLFPFKRRKVKAPETVPSIPLPVRRKERSLSSLVVSTPQVGVQSDLMGRGTKTVSRNASASRGLTVNDSIKKEDNAEDYLENSSSAENFSKTMESKRQNASKVEPSDDVSNNGTENEPEPPADKAEIWRPLNCLVEAASRTKPFKLSGQISASISGQNIGPGGETNSRRTKIGGHPHKTKIQHDAATNEVTPLIVTKTWRKHGSGRKRAASSSELETSTRALFDAASLTQERTSPIWFSLVAAPKLKEDIQLPQISTRYLRIKDGNLPVSSIQKYLAMKLDLASEAEVEITCRGQPVAPKLCLHKLADLWLQADSSQKVQVQASLGTSAQDFIMVLAYSRKALSS